MIPAKTRLEILATTYRTIDIETARFSTIQENPIEWNIQTSKLESLVSALRVQLTDYLEALDYEAEADRHAATAQELNL